MSAATLPSFDPPDSGIVLRESLAGVDDASALAEDATAASSDVSAAADLADSSDAGISNSFSANPCAGGLSFSADTQVATPSGEQPIGSLKVGATVLAYNPATGKAEPELVQHVWVNHDLDLVDVRVQTPATTTAHSASQTPPARLKAGAIATVAAAITLAVALAGASGHMQGQQATQAATARRAETIHTTANHPWLTADRG